MNSQKKVHNRSGLSKLEISDYRGYLQILDEKVWKGITPLDLFSLRGIKQEKLRSLVLKELWITEKSEEKDVKHALKRIHDIYNISVQELSTTFLLKVPEDIKKPKWQIIDKEILWKTFDKETAWKTLDAFVQSMHEVLSGQVDGYDSVIQCAILKTMYAVNDILDNRDVSILEKEMEAVLKRIKGMPWFTIISENKDEQDIYFSNSLDKKHPDYIEWRINFRIKQFQSILLKLIYNREYTTVNFLKDLLGLRVEVDNSKDPKIGEKVLNYFATNLFQAECELEQKWLFLSEEYMKQCGLPIREKKKSKKTSGLLNEAKLVWCVSCDLPLQGKSSEYYVEIQFVHIGNKNESGLNKHEIYDLKKVLSAVCRLLGTLSIGNIKVAIKDIGKKSWINEHAILHHLLFPKNDGKDEEHGFIVPIRLNGELRFITKDIYRNSLHELYGSYPWFTSLDFSEFMAKYKNTSIK